MIKVENFTPNCFTVSEENRHLISLVNAKKLSKQGELKTYNSMEEALSSLNE